MMQSVKRNVFFFLTLFTSLICLGLLWIYFGFGISFGTLCIYQGLLMILPISDISIHNRLKYSFFITGFVVGPLNTVIYTFICLDYIFEKRFAVFSDIMGFTDNQIRIQIAFIEYSISIAANALYLVLLFTAQRRLQSQSQSVIQLHVDNNVLYRSNLHNAGSESRNNQAEQQVGVQQEDNNNSSRINSSNSLPINRNNMNQNAFNLNLYGNVFIGGDLLNLNDNQNHNSVISYYRLAQFNQQLEDRDRERDRNLSSLSEQDEEEDSFYLNGQYYFRIIKIDDERQDTIKTTVCSRDAQSQDEGKECAICYEEFDKVKSVNDKRIISLDCNHTFHATCIRNSVNSIGLKCPYCRQKITKKISKCKQPSNFKIRYIAIND